MGTEPLVLVVTEDITEQVKMENQLRQAQKLEAIGQMAAGVAHDFNNHLTLILGHLSLVLEAHTLEPEVENSIRQALQAGQRAETLTRQLLAFGRKQVMERRRVNLGELFAELNGLLQRVLGEHIRVSFSAPAELPPVYADACNLERVILNLAVNARDAMPNGGQLRIGAQAVRVGAEELRRSPDAMLGPYIRLTVSDTGCGMDEATRSKAFEPFFTTKEKGKGTGMGLAAVYGIVKQHQGWILLDSEPGVGTTFTVFLPTADGVDNEEPSPASSPAADLPTRGGGETILVVEDEQPIAQFVRRVLNNNGYRTILAKDGVEALEVWRARRLEIDLLLTDVVMPNGISGKDLAERLSADMPELKIILTSGYSLDVLGLDPKLGASTLLLQKPYKPAFLLETIRQALATKSGPSNKVVNNRWSELGSGHEN
jgi:nitrogen-specific signal transduction histidine kinase/ActR/RegA family two-component response regulator